MNDEGINNTPVDNHGDPVMSLPTVEQRLATLEQNHGVVWKILNDLVGKHNSIVDGHVQAAIALLKKQGIIRDANPKE